MKPLSHKLLWILLSGFLNTSAFTQETASKPVVRFSTENELGILAGMGHKLDDGYPGSSSELVFELSSTNGIQCGRFFAGIGVGVRKWDDDFLLPLFLHASYDLWKSKNVLFLHADIGNQFGNRQMNAFGNKETGNFYAAYGLGYYFSVAERTKLYLKASVCHQRAEALGPYTGLGPSTYQERYNLNYLLFRFSVGVKFTK